MKIRIISDGSDKKGVAVGEYGPDFSNGFEGGIVNHWYGTISYYQVIKYFAGSRFYLGEFLEKRRSERNRERIKRQIKGAFNKKDSL